MNDDDVDILRWRLDVAHWGMASFYFILGGALLFARDQFPVRMYFFGDSAWISLVPFSFGVATVVGILRSNLLLSRVLLIAGLACYLTSWIFGVRQVLSHSGLVAIPFMMYAGIDMVIDSIVARRLSRKGRHRLKRKVL